MKHEPVAGEVRLAQPDADVARHYLARAETIVERRERMVDRRASAWLMIVNAGIVGGYLSVVTLGIRQEVPSVEYQTLLMPILLWAQISTGISARGDRGPLTSGRRPLVTIGGAAVLLTAFAVFVLTIVDDTVSTGWMLLPVALVLVGFGGYGVLRLMSASRGPRPLPPVRAALAPGVRGGTVLVGILLGGVCSLSAVPDGILRSVLLFVGLLALVVWLAASGTGIGLPLVGASWRWPHILAFTIAVGILFVPWISAVDGVTFAPATFLLAGLGVAVMFVLVSGVTGRDLDV